MAISEATRLLAPGIDVTLGGKTYPLIFDFEALCVIEEEMGGLRVYADRLVDDAWQLRAVRTGVVAGLKHTEIPRAQIVKLLKPRDLLKYLDALTEAFSQGTPPAEAGDDPKAEGRDDSPGAATTTSPPSSSVEPTASSGA